MQIWPAIDLRGGKCVRLRQGDYQQETVFADDPAAVARGFADAGARHLHIVDLEGAREGLPVNLPGVQAILDAVDIECELGGGIRDEQSIIELLEFGLSRLVIGTSAITDPDGFRTLCRKYPGKLVLGIDARDGRVATDGWLQTSDFGAIELARQFASEPLAAIIYTDIATDGMLRGPNLTAMAVMQEAVDVPVIASGGVTTADDVAQLAAAGPRRLHHRPGVVRGNAQARGRPPRCAECGRVTFSDNSTGGIMTRNVQDIRNIAVCGHGSSGKTTLVDHLLVKTGAVSGQPSVDAGTSICDFDDEEKHHKHSIESSVVHFDHGGKRFNVIDTPGYPDLIGQTIGALRAVDTALITVDAHAGIKVNTRRAWKEAGDAGFGRILCITKLDADQIDFPQLDRVDPRSLRQELRAVQRAGGARARSEGSRLHARPAQGHSRCARRPGERQRERCSSRSSRPTKR